VRDFVERAKRAHEVVHTWSQAQIDRLCAAMADAGEAAAHDLARMAVEETGIGRAHYKVLKNLLGSRGIWNSIKNERSVGILSRDERTGVVEVATPVGVIAGIIPTTNPTSTALGKAMIAVKGRNAIVISPHPRSKRCIGETVEVLRRAIERAGGPPDLVLSLSNPTIESTGALMKHKDVAMILATGGSGLVNAAYSSGKPAYGVGPGNVPCYIDRSADIALAARSIVTSQSFDNATLCCSEQALVIDKPIEKVLIAELKKRGAHVCNEEETAKLAKLCNKNGHMNAEVVGLDPWRIAELSGFQVPRETSVLLEEQLELARARTRPAFAELLSDAAGNLWARRYDHLDAVSFYDYSALSRSVEPPTLQGPRRWHVLDPEGRYLGDVDMPRDFIVHEIGHDQVIGVWRDALELPYVRVYRLIKPGG
jgi:acyl-CoA reductase-like NAD-dependent aldehyde dehydrogenase